MIVPERDEPDCAIGRAREEALADGMRVAIAALIGLLASPAQAAGTAVAEPSSLALFALGVLGVIIGRQSARRRRD